MLHGVFCVLHAAQAEQIAAEQALMEACKTGTASPEVKTALNDRLDAANIAVSDGRRQRLACNRQRAADTFRTADNALGNCL